MKYGLVIYDMDGTITYSINVLNKTIYEMVNKYFLKVSFDDVVRCMAATAHDTLANLGVCEDKMHESLIIFEEYFKNEGHDDLKDIVLQQSIYPAVKKSKEIGLKNGILTNSTRYVTEGILEMHQLAEYFDAVSYCSTDSREKKYRLLPFIEKLGFEKEEAIYVGDSEYDFEMTREIGVDSCFVDNEFSWYKDRDYIVNELKPTYIISDLREIPEVFH